MFQIDVTENILSNSTIVIRHDSEDANSYGMYRSDEEQLKNPGIDYATINKDLDSSIAESDN